MYFSLNTQLTKFPNLPKLSNAPPLFNQAFLRLLSTQIAPKYWETWGLY